MRDGEYNFAIRAYSHTISRFEGRAAAVETRMQAPVYHQHRPGLRREVRLGPLLEKCLCFRHGGPTGGYVEDPIRLHVEIAMAGRHGWAWARALSLWSNRHVVAAATRKAIVLALGMFQVPSVARSGDPDC